MLCLKNKITSKREERTRMRDFFVFLEILALEGLPLLKRHITWINH